MEITIATLTLLATILGVIYAIVFGPVSFREAFPDGIRNLFKTNRNWQRLVSFPKRATSVAFSPDGKQVAAGGFDNSIHLISYPKKETQHFPVHQQTIRQLAFGSSPYVIYSCADDGFVIATNYKTRQLRIVGKHDHPVYSILIDSEEKTLYAADKAGLIVAWDITAAPFQSFGGSLRVARVNKLRTTSYEGGACFSLAFIEQEERIVAAGVGGELMLIHTSTFRKRSLHQFRHTVFSLAIDKRQPTVFAACSDSHIRYFKLSDESDGTLHGHTDSIRWLLFKPPHTLISSGKDHTVRLWNLDDATQVVLEGHKDYVYQISMNPGADLLASASGDGTVVIWNLPQ